MREISYLGACAFPIWARAFVLEFESEDFQMQRCKWIKPNSNEWIKSVQLTPVVPLGFPTLKVMAGLHDCVWYMHMSIRQKLLPQSQLPPLLSQKPLPPPLPHPWKHTITPSFNPSSMQLLSSCDNAMANAPSDFAIRSLQKHRCPLIFFRLQRAAYCFHFFCRYFLSLVVCLQHLSFITYYSSGDFLRLLSFSDKIREGDDWLEPGPSWNPSLIFSLISDLKPAGTHLEPSVSYLDLEPSGT